MENLFESEKRSLAQKLLEFQRGGLVSYGKYLADQLEYAKNSKTRNAYKKYILEQIEKNKTKVEEIDEKLKQG